MIYIQATQVTTTLRIFVKKIKYNENISRDVHLEYMSYLRLGGIVLRSWSKVLMLSGLVPVFRHSGEKWQQSSQKLCTSENQYNILPLYLRNIPDWLRW